MVSSKVRTEQTSDASPITYYIIDLSIGSVKQELHLGKMDYCMILNSLLEGIGLSERVVYTLGKSDFRLEEDD